MSNDTFSVRRGFFTLRMQPMNSDPTGLQLIISEGGNNHLMNLLTEHQELLLEFLLGRLGWIEEEEEVEEEDEVGHRTRRTTKVYSRGGKRILQPRVKK